MVRSCIHLLGFSVHAIDNGELGKVKDFYFDDLQWVIRYVVVRLGVLFQGRDVLLSTAALGLAGLETINTRLTREQIRHSPDVSTETPVTRQYEEELHRYYALPYYWSYQELRDHRSEEAHNTHLQSMKELLGYHIQAPDGEIGHVSDFLLEDGAWRIRYLIVNTGNWLSGKKILLAAAWAQKILWDVSKIIVDISKEKIRSAPDYTSSDLVNRRYEMDLYRYYGKEYA